MKEINYAYQGKALANLGRFYNDEGRKARMFTFSCSGFEVAFVGTFLKAEFIATECGRPQGEAAIQVVIDDVPFSKSRKITLNQPDSFYVLAEGLPFKEHRVRVYKRTESACSLTGWRQIVTDGRFVSLTKSKRLKIEIYGDSITAGNGVEGVPGDDVFETRTENALKSYGALASEKLDADFSIIAIGGYALYRSPWNAEAAIKNIPQMFSFADCTWSTTLQNAIPWNHRHFTPDIVVINLGTNDDQYLLPLPEEEQKRECLNFKKTANGFLDLIFKTYPHCQVLLCIGMISVKLVPSLLKEVADSYPRKVAFHVFDSLKAGGYMACGGHPNALMHYLAAEELVKEIDALTGKPVQK